MATQRNFYRVPLLVMLALLLAACTRTPAESPLVLPTEILRLADDFSVRLESGPNQAPVVIAYFDAQGRPRVSAYQRFNLTAEPTTGDRGAAAAGPIVLDTRRAARQSLGQVTLPTGAGNIRIRLALYQNSRELSASIEIKPLRRAGDFALQSATLQTGEREVPGLDITPPPTSRPIEQQPPAIALQTGGQQHPGAQYSFCWDIGCLDLTWAPPADVIAIERGATITVAIPITLTPTSPIALTVSEPLQRTPLHEFTLPASLAAPWRVDLPAGSYTIMVKATWGVQRFTSRLFRIAVTDPVAEATARAHQYRLLFAGDDGNLWLVASTGRQTLLTDLPTVGAIANQPVAGLSAFAAAPDGRQVALAWYELAPNDVITAHLDLLDLETRRRQPLDLLANLPSQVFGPDAAQRAFADLAWAPAAETPRLAYTRAEDRIWAARPGVKPIAFSQVWQVVPGQSAPAPLFAPPADGRDLAPQWLADGRLLFLRQSSQESAPSLWQLAAAEQAPRRLRPNVLAFRLAPLSGRLAWIGLDLRPQPAGASGQPLALWLAPSLTGTGQAVSDPGQTFGDLAWRPASQAAAEVLALSGGRLADATLGILLWNPDQGLAALTNGPRDGQPLWLPHDQGLIYTRIQDDGSHALWRMDAGGQNQRIFLANGAQSRLLP